jgi:hypothetical protein
MLDILHAFTLPVAITSAGFLAGFIYREWISRERRRKSKTSFTHGV